MEQLEIAATEMERSGIANTYRTLLVSGNLLALDTWENVKQSIVGLSEGSSKAQMDYQLTAVLCCEYRRRRTGDGGSGQSERCQNALDRHTIDDS